MPVLLDLFFVTHHEKRRTRRSNEGYEALGTLEVAAGLEPAYAVLQTAA